ncbi:MAG: bifunctional [glutamine synthetase] adenylyltransferase/[glutamine synthetase]-adenylyl-L-tyrosine phosphorylase [Pseudomonadota bacterium]
MGSKTPGNDQPLGAALETLPPPAYCKSAQDFLEDLKTAALRQGADGELSAALAVADTALVLSSIAAGSHYLRDWMLRDPARLTEILARKFDETIRHSTADLATDMAEATRIADAMAALRKHKSVVAPAVALADLGGVIDVNRVIAETSALADRTVAAAIDWLLGHHAQDDRFFPADPKHPSRDSGLIVLAMGKHGARELNVSSDIDLILFYENRPERFTDGEDLSKFYVRLARDLVKMMQERTGEGYVFRTDLRLRPDPSATPLAISVAGALQYYESLGQNWERAAMIKARPCAGDISAGDRFVAEIGPFIWRKYLDFASIADTHAMKRQIHQHKGHGAIAVAGHNIKLGRGGIREIEFFAQTQQLIGGGRNPDLRVRPTLQALERLSAAGWIGEGVATDLSDAYRVLRSIEHRIQYIADEQRQTLPAGEDELEAFARLSGFSDRRSLETKLTETMQVVQKHYARLFESQDELGAKCGSLVFVGDSNDPETLETLSGLGFSRPEDVSDIVRTWHYGRYPALRSQRGRQLLTELIPQILTTFSVSANADGAIIAFDGFLRRLPAGVQIFSLLKARPGLLKLLARILSSAPRLAETLSSRPQLFDAMIDSDLLARQPKPREIAGLLAAALAEARDFEDILDRARIFAKEQTVLIGTRILSGELPAEAAGEAFSDVADAVIAKLFDAVKASMQAAHGQLEGGAFAVLAMGRLGSREMTATSDVDLILIYDHDARARDSDGPKALGPSQYAMRFTQRFIAAISAPTSVGALYEVDMRLRPSGRSGPVATHIESFEDYQLNQAWSWEHMALTRARPLCGDPELVSRIEEVIDSVLSERRDRAQLAQDIVDMRARIAKEKGSEDPWNLKHKSGGLVDLEFITQFLQLSEGPNHHALLRLRPGEVVAQANTLGLIPPDTAETLAKAALLYARLNQILRLCMGDGQSPDNAPQGLIDSLIEVTVVPDYSYLKATISDTETAVDQIFSELIVGQI